MDDLGYDLLNYGAQGDPASQFSDWLDYLLVHDNTWSMGNPPNHIAEQPATDLTIPSSSYVTKPWRFLSPFERIFTGVSRTTSLLPLRHYPPKHPPRNASTRTATKPVRPCEPKESGPVVPARESSVGARTVNDISRLRKSEWYGSLATRSTGGMTLSGGIIISIERGWISDDTLGTSGSRTHSFMCEGFSLLFFFCSCWSRKRAPW